MRTKRTVGVLAALLAVSLLPVLTASAHHGPTAADVLAMAQGLGMGCQSTSTEIDCVGGPASPKENSSSVFKPASGPLTQVVTRVNAHTNGIHDFSMANRDWFATIHRVGCADTQSEQAAVRQFMNDLALTFEPSSSGGGTYGPFAIGECSMVGKLIFNDSQIRAPYWYWEVTSMTLAGAFPTPSPTVKPTVKPTPRPTAKPTLRPTVRPTPTATATPSPTPTPTPTPIPTPTATPIPIHTPEQTVLGFTFTPEPSSAPPAPAGGSDDWAGSVPSAGEVSADAVRLAGSGFAALLLLLAMGFIGELFNNTFEANYDRILAGWRRSWLGRLGKAFSGLWGGGK
jgi:hypothetical protein